MPWHYTLFVVESAGAWSLEIEDPTGVREQLRQFPDYPTAAEKALALCHQHRETGDLAELQAPILPGNASNA